MKAPIPLAHPQLPDPESRRRKARKIEHVLLDFLGQDIQNLWCLDIGCSTGVIAAHLAIRFGHVIGIDPYKTALELAWKERRCSNLAFLLGDGTSLPFKNEAFEVIVCAQVYEHVRDARKLFSEIHRVLTRGGICFFSGPNKLFPIEPHYFLPFLHWLPRKLANWYLRLSGRGECYDELLMSYWQLRRTLSDFEIRDYTPEMIIKPDEYFCADEVKGKSLFKRFPLSALRKLIFLAPNCNWVLKKTSPEIP
jgi:SAM-dependent methyltransferase